MSARAQALESLLRPLAAQVLGSVFGVASLAVSEITPTPLGGMPLELLGAGERRRATFCAGRACAGRALNTLGTPTVPIAMGAAGAPQWPSGVVGSISHTDHLAAAVVARSPPVAGLGLDVDEDTGLDDQDMLHLVCRPEELAAQAQGDPASLRHGKLLFVIKEAVYKLHRPLGGEFLEFHDVVVTADASRGRFHAELPDPSKMGRAGRTFGGVFQRDHGLVVALVAFHDRKNSGSLNDSVEEPDSRATGRHR